MAAQMSWQADTTTHSFLCSSLVDLCLLAVLTVSTGHTYVPWTHFLIALGQVAGQALVSHMILHAEASEVLQNVLYNPMQHSQLCGFLLRHSFLYIFPSFFFL